MSDAPERHRSADSPSLIKSVLWNALGSLAAVVLVAVPDLVAAVDRSDSVVRTLEVSALAAGVLAATSFGTLAFIRWRRRPAESGRRSTGLDALAHRVEQQRRNARSLAAAEGRASREQ
jgi:hypothetical protein